MKQENLISSRETASVYRVGNTAVKIFNPKHPISEVLNEALNTARVEETGLNIPKILEVSLINGKWAITTEFIEGKTISKLMEENPDKVEYYINLMVDLQISINEKKCPLLNRLKEKMTRQIESLEELDNSRKYELLTRLEGMPKHSKLCHGDFNPSNIILSDDKAYILDWVHAAQGNASADVARTYLLFSLNSIAQAEMYLDLFCKKTNTSRQYVQRWLPIVAAAQLAKKRPEENELLMNWLDVVEYE